MSGRLEQELFVALVRAHDVATRPFASLFKSAGLSAPQYNVLRILRGAGEQGISCQGIRDRLIARVPDVTRLLDRLESAGMVRRDRDIGEDRRVVLVRITGRGMRLLTELDGPVEATHREQFSGLTSRETASLRRLLGKIHEP